MKLLSDFKPPHSLVAVVLYSLVGGGCAPLEPTPPEPLRPAHAVKPTPEFRPVPGAEHVMREATIRIEKLDKIAAHLEIRTITLRPKVEATLPVNHEVILEVRGGAVETAVNGERKTYFPGDMWLVPLGSRVTLKGIGETVVLRAIYFVKE